MRIGEAARATGLTIKAIRHYEEIGLVHVERDGVYRAFSADEIERLKIIARCRSLEFSTAEIQDILGLVDDARPQCPPPEAMAALVTKKLDDTRQQIDALLSRAESLEQIRAYVTSRV